MSLSRLLNQPLQLQRQGNVTTNVYGDSIVGALAAPVTVYGFLYQQSTREVLVDRDVVVSDWHCHLPASTTVGALDYITFNGQKFQVDGDPHYVYNPRTKQVSHIDCKLVVAK